jgi:antitoxin HicB
MTKNVLNLRIERLPEGVYLATSPDMPGLIAQAESLEETLEIAADIVRKLRESYIECGELLPDWLEM